MKPGRNDPCPCGSGKKYKQCCQLRPAAPAKNNSAATIQTALEHHRAGRLAQAEEIYKQVLQADPSHPDALHYLGAIAIDQGRYEEAADLIGRAIRIKPSRSMYYNLGNALRELNKLDEAVENFRHALALDPNYAEAYTNLGGVLLVQHKLEEAIKSYRRALELKPRYTETYPSACSNLLFLYGYHATLSHEAYLAEARGWELACVLAEERLAARNRVFSPPPLDGRRLKVGYVSGDYRKHAVSSFIEQLFASHDRTRIELFAYSVNRQEDTVTARIKALPEHWVPVHGDTVPELYNRIRKDGIDVLVDLSGHTGHNRMEVFARRAAPVQVHYLGYFASTGLTEMDYLIGDKVLTPPELDWHFTEHIWRLPRVRASYDSKADVPSTRWQPDKSGTIWIGSFNNLGKLTPATLALWAKVLHALPQARLLLKTKEFTDEVNRRRILDEVCSHGIPAERIELNDSSSTLDWKGHMAYYDRLDIALDPIGAHGGYTTTCDALWMGVPVITLIGDRMASRMAASILDAIGHPEWIAHSEAEYIDKVVALANNAREREQLRFAQRERMAASPLCDAKNLAKEMENAYLEMFQLWQKKQK